MNEITYSQILKYQTEEEIQKQRDAYERYALRNRTQMLIMKNIAWYHDLVFMKGQIRFFNDWFRLKLYLYKKYKISF